MVNRNREKKLLFLLVPNRINGRAGDKVDQRWKEKEEAEEEEEEVDSWIFFFGKNENNKNSKKQKTIAGENSERFWEGKHGGLRRR